MRRLFGRHLWLLTALWAGGLAVTSLLPSGGEGLASWDRSITPTTQNFLHIPAYAGLAALLGLAASRRGGVCVILAAGVAIACTGYGGLLELAQGMVPGRMASGMDALLNAIGAAGGVGVAMAIRAVEARRARRLAEAKPHD